MSKNLSLTEKLDMCGDVSEKETSLNTYTVEAGYTTKYSKKEVWDVELEARSEYDAINRANVPREVEGNKITFVQVYIGSSKWG